MIISLLGTAGKARTACPRCGIHQSAIRLLHGLRRPYQYRPGSIYLDWTTACWRLLPVAQEPDPHQVLADWLESLKESGDRQQLEDIASDVDAALKGLPQDEPEPD